MPTSIFFELLIIRNTLNLVPRTSNLRDSKRLNVRAMLLVGWLYFASYTTCILHLFYSFSFGYTEQALTSQRDRFINVYAVR